MCLWSVIDNVHVSRCNSVMKKYGCVGAIVLFMAVISGLAGLWLYYRSRHPVPEAVLSMPERVTIRDKFAIKLHITNNQNQTILLESVDISKSLLDGFHILKTEPICEPVSLHVLGQRSWPFGVAMAPGSAVILHFQAIATNIPGEYSGFIDVCNKYQDAVRLKAALTVWTNSEDSVKPE